MRTPDYAPRVVAPGILLPDTPVGATLARIVIERRGWEVRYRVKCEENEPEAIRLIGGYTTQFKLAPRRGPLFGSPFLYSGGAVNTMQPGEDREFIYRPSMTGGSGYIDIPVGQLRRAGMMIYPFSSGGFKLEWVDGTDAGPAEVLSESCWYEFSVLYE